MLVAQLDQGTPRLDFGRGVYFRHVIGTTYERVTQSCTHLYFVEAAEIEYESSLEAERIKQRSYPQ